MQRTMKLHNILHVIFLSTRLREFATEMFPSLHRPGGFEPNKLLQVVQLPIALKLANEHEEEKKYANFLLHGTSAG